ncbi:hypothetical protein EZ449_20835 [Pedobacter frigidisoli]|uniref:Uncharacterized protein n=1 Tax=Pedobacter frigidisoli TaxID=2530455 RepID=A0A4V2ML10_9SPHI|nr:hypothetical protein [Pedobacter frigidisoli]TCD00297.1 hypothetical protein EZ449_20835 [Pedobacter frigidisoli]
MEHLKEVSIPTLVFVILLFTTGCLVPGAPHHFIYKSTSNSVDSVDLATMTWHIEYHLYSKQKNTDSIFVLFPIDNQFKKMQVDEKRIFGDFYRTERVQMRDVRKIESKDSIVIKIFSDKTERNQVFKYVPEAQRSLRYRR